MIRISQIKMPIRHTEQELLAKIAKTLRISREEIRAWTIVKQSIDARKKDQILYSYTVDVETVREQRILKTVRNPQIMAVRDEPYRFPTGGNEKLDHPPVIVGSGPAGLFCGLMLAEAGFRPLILERGDDVDLRRRKVDRFWRDGVLDIRTNVQFGEGGAGTFSDGKLNTLVKDPAGRNKLVLQILAEYGADPAILYENKPHIGTDVLADVVKRIRGRIVELGGSVRFDSQVTDILIENGRIKALQVSGSNPGLIPVSAAVLAVGHSARDTFSMLMRRGVPMQQKAFAVGLRIQHPQRMIDESQYGTEAARILGPASYKVTHQAGNGRGVYSFCMCPGGYVVNASSEAGCLAVNGMSYHDRGGKNANSALIVTVTPEDFGGDSPLAGVEYQRRLERLAFSYGDGRIPAQLYGDFKNRLESRDWGDVEPEFKGGARLSNLREMLPAYLSDALVEGVEAFEQKIRGFSRYDSILAGVESRTSSPVRIPRDERMESSVLGLFPCGEGAGYAGGITSAAMDGIRVAEELGKRYRPE